MKIRLSDIFIGNYPVTQYFGANPSYYSQFGLKGHEGVDWGMPNYTQLICPFDEAIVVRKEISNYGAYGKHVVLWDDVQKAAVWFCHLHTVNVNIGDVVFKHNLVALSNNTGNSTGPHLHLGVCRTDENGIRINADNGYLGFLDPFEVCEWVIENPDKPTEGGGFMPDKVCLEPSKFEELVSKSSKYDEFKKEGYETVSVVRRRVEELLGHIQEAKDTARVEKERADEYRRQYNELIADLASEPYFNTTQEVTEILSQAKKASAAIKELEDLQRAFAGYKVTAEGLESNLNAEIKRLKALLDQKDVLENAKLEELLKEIVNRLVKMVTFKKR
jgi:hypothetical protein